MAEEVFFEAGQRIAKLRGKLTQAGFAQRLGVSRSSVEGWEAGKRLPDGSSLLRMREAFGADINVLLDGKEGGVAPALRPDEEKLLADYRAAHSDARERIRQVAATAANSPKRGANPGGRTVVDGVSNEVESAHANVEIKGNRNRVRTGFKQQG